MCGIGDRMNQQQATTSAPPSQDPIDFSNQYNTALTTAQEAKYEAWVKGNNNQNRDMSGDVYNYDLKGYWSKYINGDSKQEDNANGHLTDEFKKPNHPTFSDQSVYNNVDGNVGGKWTAIGKNKWEFTPSATSIKLLGKDYIAKYWADKEQPEGNVLKIKE